jgi:predicted  nucleic acid-binding Zn-ribbon protein
MLKIDENESEQKELIQFFPGFEKTILEIKAEIEITQKKVNLEISGLKMRINNLKEITEPKLIQAYQSTRKRYPEGNALCFTLQAKCLECRFAIPRQTESQLEHGALIEYCPGCSRLLTPISCKY